MLTAEQFFANGNSALRDGRYASAIRSYVNALMLSREEVLTAQYGFNLAIARDRYRAERENSESIDVGVCCWDLAHNAAGRAHTIATVYKDLSEAQVTLIGGLFQDNGSQIWGPLRGAEFPVKALPIMRIEDEFLRRASKFVLAFPKDIVHLVKPRFPNIIFGVLYKLIWRARVFMDVDDNELAFVNADNALAVEDWLESPTGTDPWTHLSGGTATRLAVGLADSFDGMTVVNTALQQCFGGVLVRHARDPDVFSPSAARRARAREEWGIGAEQRVILFLGTPRAHKGLLETGRAIASLRRSNILYLVVGTFPQGQSQLKTDLLSIEGLTVRFADSQPFERIPDTLACADLVVLFQDMQSPAACFQTPAKLSDALAMGIRVIAEITPGLEDLAALDEQSEQIVPATTETLPASIEAALEMTLPSHAQHPTPRQSPLFREHLSLSANSFVLRQLLDASRDMSVEKSLFGTRMESLIQLEKFNWLIGPLLRHSGGN